MTTAPGGEGASQIWTGPGWQLEVSATELLASTPDESVLIEAARAADLDVRRRWLRWQLVDGGVRVLRLRRLSRDRAHELRRAVRMLRFAAAIASAKAWRAAVEDRLASARSEQRWIPIETFDGLLRSQPDAGLPERIQRSGLLESLTEAQKADVAFVETNLAALVGEANEEILDAELRSRRAFFDSIEKAPLTDEQARAVACYDNRVQLLAAAGSGKTAVMVARAAYAVERGFVAPDRVLLLAFNKAAAVELEQRVRARFAAAGIPSDGVKAATFHSFGLDVIGRATGTKPRLASWLDGGGDVRAILSIVDALCARSEPFRYCWDLYRMLFANAPTKLETDEPDSYDRKTSQTGYRTFAGETVRSHGERLIANFMFLNGVNYRYERPYPHPTADGTHSAYRPDFYYPDIDVWHEHWALDRDGNPPADFKGYREGMAWKRAVHARHRTRLVESAWGEVMFGDGLAQLKRELTGLGLRFNWDPDRPIPDDRSRPVRNEALARLVRTFMAHVKSNSWTREALDERLRGELRGLDGFRTRLFLELYWGIHAAWQERLDSEGSVDFEDMLVEAASHLEQGTTTCPHELVLVDELQDASRARARLVAGLLRKPDRYLLAVGDDWQSINRFAGADLSVMTDFESWFGRGPQLALTTTFRCPQTICDVASRFVGKNPAQFAKGMRSAQREKGPPVTVFRSNDPARALADHLADLSEQVAVGRATGGANGKVTVDILGRYGFESDLVPQRTPRNLDVCFRTVHGAKGLEADYVVVPNLGAGVYGFPSNVVDDPVLAVAMPASEEFEHAEERRLFYVALTRARRQVTLIAPRDRMSPFIVELLDSPDVEVIDLGGPPARVCPECREGTMVARNGRYGAFLGCSRFPKCKKTQRADSAPNVA